MGTRRLKGYWECASRFEECSDCGQEAMCTIYQGEMEEETGYRDEVALCEACDAAMREADS